MSLVNRHFHRLGAARKLALVAAVIVAFALAGGRPSRRPDVLLIVIDTLRADHLGSYGYPRPTSPGLDALARRGVRFSHALAPSSWTLPTVASIMTGTYPAVHGAESNTATLSQRHVTMAEVLRQAGYATAAFSANPAFVIPETGLAQGFEVFRVLRGPPVPRSEGGDFVPADPWLQSTVEVAGADIVTDAAIDWLRASDGRRPFLLYVHYYDPHAGYFPPPEYASRFGVAPDAPLAGPAQWKVLLDRTATPTAETLAILEALYDAEIAFTDAEIVRLLRGFADVCRRPRVVIVTSDHGEEFGEHGGLQHGRTLYEETIHVPLIMIAPEARRGSTVDRDVALVDLWPTLAELTGTNITGPIDGESLMPLLRKESSRLPISLYADLQARFPGDPVVHHRAIIQTPWKLVLGVDGVPRLYDLEADPDEQHDLAPRQKARTALMNVLLRHRNQQATARRADAPPGVYALTSERRERLKRLGYLD